MGVTDNTDTNSIGGGMELNYNPKPWLFTLKGAYLKAATDSITTAESMAISLRATRDLTERIDVFVGAGWLRNRFSGINNIYNFDGGAGPWRINADMPAPGPPCSTTTGLPAGLPHSS